MTRAGETLPPMHFPLINKTIDPPSLPSLSLSLLRAGTLFPVDILNSHNVSVDGKGGCFSGTNCTRMHHMTISYVRSVIEITNQRMIANFLFIIRHVHRALHRSTCMITPTRCYFAVPQCAIYLASNKSNPKHYIIVWRWWFHIRVETKYMSCICHSYTTTVHACTHTHTHTHTQTWPDNSSRSQQRQCDFVQKAPPPSLIQEHPYVCGMDVHVHTVCTLSSGCATVC